MKYLLILLAVVSSVHASGVDKDTYFKGTDHPLEVYTVEGKQNGPVVLIIGGIHGDETSTIEAAQGYTKAQIENGTLIVIPKANVPAITRNVRMIDCDMNRLFSDQEVEDKYEYEVTAKIKEFVKKADLVLNLHEGTGLYSRTKKGMGQSVVADSDKVLDLKTLALSALKIMNKNIKQKKYYFKFNNQNTASAKTKYPEQKGSLTYYSVYTAGKPAFGIEISSNIKDSEYRVKLAMEAVDAFLKIVGIEHGF